MTQPKPAPSPMASPSTWDAVAPGFAKEIWRTPVFAEAAIALAAPGPNARVLDVAAGSGALTFVAAPKVAEVVAVDFSSGMIAELSARAAREGATNVTAKVMNAEQLELPDASFDAAFCLFGFMFFPDRARAFRELRRVLKPGSRAVMATWTPIANRPLMRVGFDALAEVMPELPRAQKGDLQEPSECIAEMSAAGFADVQTRNVTTEVAFESPEHYFDLTERTSAPLGMMRKRMGEEAWAQTRERLLTVLERTIPRDGGAKLSAEAILTVGTA